MVLQVSVNVEELLVQGLFRLDSEIQEVFGTSPCRVYTMVPAKDPAYPLAIVRRLGGQLAFSHHLWLDRARVQWDVWGDSKTSTWRAADKMRSLFIAGQSTNYVPHGRLDGVTETIGPTYVRDPDSNQHFHHYFGQMLVNVRPLAVTTASS